MLELLALLSTGAIAWALSDLFFDDDDGNERGHEDDTPPRNRVEPDLEVEEPRRAG